MRNVAVVLYFWLFSVVSFGSENIPTTEFKMPRSIYQEDLACPDGSQREITFLLIKENAMWRHSCETVNGIPEGNFSYWHGDVLAFKGTYKNGKINGRMTIYDKKGNIEEEKLYKDGVVQQ